MNNKPTILFYEANDFRFYGAARSLLWLMERAERIHPLFAAPGDGPLTQNVRAAGIETLTVALAGGSNHKKASFSAGTALHILRLARLIRRRNVRGVHANSTRAAIYAGLAARLTGTPMWWHIRRERPRGRRERLALALCDRAICVSSAVTRRMGPTPKTVTILNGVPLERLDPNADGQALRRQLGWDAGHVVIGSVASIAPNKRHDLFIDLAHRLAPRFPQARFLICGHVPAGAPPDHRIELEQRAGSLLAEGRLAMPGFIEAMSAAYAAMNILVFPSDNEGFGLVAVEAMMMGVPVVRTNTAGAEDMIEEGVTGYIVPVGDLDALSARTAALLADPDRRRSVGAAAQNIARRQFTARRVAAEVETLMLERIGHGN